MYFCSFSSGQGYSAIVPHFCIAQNCRKDNEILRALTFLTIGILIVICKATTLTDVLRHWNVDGDLCPWAPEEDGEIFPSTSNSPICDCLKRSIIDFNQSFSYNILDIPLHKTCMTRFF